MKRRTWFKSVAAFGVAAMWPWKKRSNARLCYADVTYNLIDVDRDQTERIRRLHADGAAGYVRDVDDWRLSISDCDESVYLFWDLCQPRPNGKYRSASCAIKKHLARTMDDATLRRKIADAMWYSVCKNHHVSLFDLGPPPEWIT